MLCCTHMLQCTRYNFTFLRQRRSCIDCSSILSNNSLSLLSTQNIERSRQSSKLREITIQEKLPYLDLELILINCLHTQYDFAPNDLHNWTAWQQSNGWDISENDGIKKNWINPNKLIRDFGQLFLNAFIIIHFKTIHGRYFPFELFWSPVVDVCAYAISVHARTSAHSIGDNFVEMSGQKQYILHMLPYAVHLEVIFDRTNDHR